MSPAPARCVTMTGWLGLLLGSSASFAQTPQPPYRDSRLPIEARVNDLLGRMTLAEKFWQLFMLPDDVDNPTHDFSQGVFGLQVSPAGADARSHAEHINRIQRYFRDKTRLGIPIIPFDEALHGLVREGATAFPQAIGLAATWDTALMGRVAGAIARETRSRGIRQVLSPVVNIASDVRWGRVEETYGEDPLLASLMGRAFVAAFEHSGIVTTPKHLVANVGEGGRDSYPIGLSRRSLEEYFFPPFKAAVDQGSRSIMTAYNSVDGSPATQNAWLLTDILKRAWGFRGYVISDAAATGGATVLHRTEPTTAAAARHALESGLDVIFQSSWEQYLPYWEAFRQGMIVAPVIDSAVARVLRVKFDLGLFEENPLVDPDSAAYWNGHPSHRELAREAARASIVLLKNAHGLLPLGNSVRSIAVIGQDGADARLGGYSRPGDAVSLLEGMRRRLGPSARVEHAPGPGRMTSTYVVVPAQNLESERAGGLVRGLSAQYFDNIRLEGQPRLERNDSVVSFAWTLNSPGPGIPLDWYSVRWQGRLTAPASGVRRIGILGDDGFRLWLDGKLLIDNWRKQSFGLRMVDVALTPGRSYNLRLEYFETTGNGRIGLVWDGGIDSNWQRRIDTAVAVAKRSDVAIIAAGIEEGEFRDRAHLGLPGHQEQMIRAVAATGTPVVVVLVGGSAITMSSWLDSVGAVLDVWYPGEEGGNAIAEVLMGDSSPGGRLPITFPLAEGQLPLYYNHKPTGRGDDYVDLTGRPLFPFGFGLSYTSFEYSDLRIEPAIIDPAGTAVVRCRIINAGDRPGDEVVQLYLHDLIATVTRPVMELKGFQRVHLAPGESRELSFKLTHQDLLMLNADLRWVVEPGDFRVMVGASSRDIRLRGTLTVQ